MKAMLISQEPLPEWTRDGIDLPGDTPFAGDQLFLGPGGPNTVMLRVTRRAFIVTNDTDRDDGIDVILWVRSASAH